MMDIVPILRSISQRLDRTARQACTDGAAEIERLRALVSEAAEIMDGDGEYPETAKRFREALAHEHSGDKKV